MQGKQGLLVYISVNPGLLQCTCEGTGHHNLESFTCAMTCGLMIATDLSCRYICLLRFSTRLIVTIGLARILTLVAILGILLLVVHLQAKACCLMLVHCWEANWDCQAKVACRHVNLQQAGSTSHRLSCPNSNIAVSQIGNNAIQAWGRQKEER